MAFCIRIDNKLMEGVYETVHEAEEYKRKMQANGIRGNIQIGPPRSNETPIYKKFTFIRGKQIGYQHFRHPFKNKRFYFMCLGCGKKLLKDSSYCAKCKRKAPKE